METGREIYIIEIPHQNTGRRIYPRCWSARDADSAAAAIEKKFESGGGIYPFLAERGRDVYEKNARGEFIVRPIKFDLEDYLKMYAAHVFELFVFAGAEQARAALRKRKIWRRMGAKHGKRARAALKNEIEKNSQNGSGCNPGGWPNG